MIFFQGCRKHISTRHCTETKLTDNVMNVMLTPCLTPVHIRLSLRFDEVRDSDTTISWR